MQSALDYLTRDESRFVEELCDYVRFRFERRQLARLPHADATYRKFLGMPELFGEMRFTSIERRSARPTPEINGLTSGHRGEGSKTIIPTPASAKLTLRLVPNQKPDHIAALVRRNLKKICPRTVRLEIEEGHDGEPCLISPTKPLAKDGLHALKAALAQEPVLMREGGSIPIINEFKKALGADILLPGLALPDDNAHSPNEKFSLDAFAMGMKMSACSGRSWPRPNREGAEPGFQNNPGQG